MMGNRNLHAARRNKNDEFYTQYADIEREVSNYWEQLKGKTVYCNTDNYKESNFVKYFVDNFDKIQLKKLISLDLDGNYFEYDGRVKQYSKFKNGDFRSEESKELLKGCDVVCTNPPFSLFREYVAQLIEYEKEFLIIGNNNALTYKEIFQLLKDNKIWLGYHSNKTMEFRLPDYYEKWDRVDEDGVKYGKVPAISWFTNMDVAKRHEYIPLHKDYKGNEDAYPKYDNYDAINVDRIKDIPRDYEGYMGVPITIMTKYNPEQFEIIGIMNTGEENKGIRLPGTPHGRPVVNGVEKYLRYIIKNKNPKIKEDTEDKMIEILSCKWYPNML